ncbi:uncharacterized protein PV07_02622 [Cladophialophora immunda]|uniref:Uncharacterized protein n=1 Tax=Cladophialophora immunda TaxID=569365 RepID=A0A0D1ZSA6_9EURO|nr:uncharacterized protein PV07_02622 [Cladophialophora immunda]KIW30931.1 hypothetical protein PV07_02622 [Cladophialophora immunda]
MTNIQPARLYTEELEGPVHSSGLKFLQYDWRGYSERLEHENQRLHQSLTVLSNARDQEHEIVGRLEAQNAKLEHRAGEMTQSLNTINTEYSRLRTEYHRLTQALAQSQNRESIAWSSYEQLRNLFSGKAKDGGTDVDLNNAESLRLCIVNLVVKSQWKEMDIRGLQTKVNTQQAEIQRLMMEIGRLEAMSLSPSSSGESDADTIEEEKESVDHS